MQIITLMLTFIVMILVVGGIMWWYVYCKSKFKKYNGFLWVHPDKGGGIIGITKEPGLQKPFYFNYRALELGLSFFRQPVWMWAQDKVTDAKGNVSYPIKHWEPIEPADYMLQATPEGDPDKSRPYVSPNELFDTTDWSALRQLETAKNPWQETIKIGMAIIMACVCIFGIIVALDMIGKKDVPTKPIQTSNKPLTQIIQPLKYGGLKYGN